jgi:sialate O-acetylesterase
MTANYNLRIHPARHFRISGMIWYQGESDIGNSADEYSDCIDLLQRSYTEVFGYKKGLLPFIYTQLASYFYSEDGLCLPQRNIDFSDIQQERPESRALVAIYDLPLTFLPEAGSIHPETKKEIGNIVKVTSHVLSELISPSLSSPSSEAISLMKVAKFISPHSVTPLSTNWKDIKNPSKLT